MKYSFSFSYPKRVNDPARSGFTVDYLKSVGKALGIEEDFFVKSYNEDKNFREVIDRHLKTPSILNQGGKEQAHSYKYPVKFTQCDGYTLIECRDFPEFRSFSRDDEASTLKACQDLENFILIQKFKKVELPEPSEAQDDERMISIVFL